MKTLVSPRVRRTGSDNASRRRAAGVVEPGWLKLARAALVVLTFGDAALLYSCAVRGLDDDFLPIPITLSVLLGCVLVPHLLGRLVAARRESGEGLPVKAVCGMAALFAVLVAAVTYFRMVGDISLFAGAAAAQAGGAADLSAIGQSVESGDASSQTALTVLMSVMLVVTAVCSFFTAAWDDRGREAAERELSCRELLDSLEARRAELVDALEGPTSLRVSDEAVYASACDQVRARYVTIKDEVRTRIAIALADPASTTRLEQSR